VFDFFFFSFFVDDNSYFIIIIKAPMDGYRSLEIGRSLPIGTVCR